MNDDKDFLSFDQVVSRYPVSRGELVLLALQGEIKLCRIEGKFYICRESLNIFFERKWEEQKEALLDDAHRIKQKIPGRKTGTEQDGFPDFQEAIKKLEIFTLPLEQEDSVEIDKSLLEGIREQLANRRKPRESPGEMEEEVLKKIKGNQEDDKNSKTAEEEPPMIKAFQSASRQDMEKIKNKISLFSGNFFKNFMAFIQLFRDLEEDKKK